MSLYEKSYLNLSPEEEVERDLLERKEGGPIKINNTQDYFNVSKAVRHNRTLFPNYYLDPRDLDEPYVNLATAHFETLLDQPEVTEREVVKFIKEQRHYFIIGSILNSGPYRFGHHSAFLFPEFRLGPNYRADYLISGKGSDGYELIFVELECPQKKATLADGGFADSLRKGLDQVNRWKIWLEMNYTSLMLTLADHKSPRETLPLEFHRFDPSRLHFVVVAGRRRDFTEYTYRKQRQENRSDNLSIIHYDNLIDYAKRMSNARTY